MISSSLSSRILVGFDVSLCGLAVAWAAPWVVVLAVEVCGWVSCTCLLLLLVNSMRLRVLDLYLRLSVAG